MRALPRGERRSKHLVPRVMRAKYDWARDEIPPFPLIFLSVFLIYCTTIIMMRHDMGWEIPEQEKLAVETGWTGLGMDDGVFQVYNAHKGDTSVSVTYTYTCTGDGCILHNTK